MQCAGAIHNVGFALCCFPFGILLVEVLPVIGCVMSGGPFSLTMVAFCTPFTISTFHHLLEDRFVTFVMIRLVSFSPTHVSPTPVFAIDDVCPGDPLGFPRGPMD